MPTPLRVKVIESSLESLSIKHKDAKALESLRRSVPGRANSLNLFAIRRGSFALFSIETGEYFWELSAEWSIPTSLLRTNYQVNIVYD
jgi:hypothetical protein